MVAAIERIVAVTGGAQIFVNSSQEGSLVSLVATDKIIIEAG
jgi:hypothetical protein